MPSTGRILMLNAGTERKDGVLTCFVIDTRLVTAKQQHETWSGNDQEPCVAIVCFREWFEAAKLAHGRSLKQARYERI